MRPSFQKAIKKDLILISAPTFQNAKGPALKPKIVN